MKSERLLHGGSTPGAGNLTCACGSTWFELRGDAIDDPPLIAYGVDGSIVAVAGEPRCVECGRLPILPGSGSED
jgi:hypothetical protein